MMPDFWRIFSPGRSTILPTQLSGVPGNSCLNWSSNVTASTLAKRETELVILAIGQRGEQRRLGGFGLAGAQPCLAADRQGALEQLGPGVGLGEQMAEIAGQAVAQIDHRTWLMVRGQPARLREARRELEMMSGNRAAQFAGHPYAVANACAAAENAFVARNLADERHADEEPLRVGHRLAADQRHAVPLGQGGHAVVNRLDTFGRRSRPANQA